ncbi:NAD(P)/FAD-dependent oxidoreductase [Virgibacillus soli]|uniref:NAD(P)/FAD-dependent oxidoreductase n=1 Tax=Paracerasibacillus soli TaxID=480284 RepID=A0ABU5CUQ2_9BACI|nr:NAD(P)/FAD-dependent oxidoreductase [Virgibacillus soli]MDY0410098.1 NAD(P)/FAD-dependent oxidoreductase [Virgibacillus soli]
MKKTTLYHDGETLGNNESAVVVGASLSGLMTGIALAREGLHVTIIEKAEEERPSGGGLRVDGGMFDRSKTARLLKRLASNGKSSVQLWSSIEYRMRMEAKADPRIELRYQTRVQSIDQDANSAWVVTDKGETIQGDILIGADGHRSLVRRHVAPHHPDATFAGYVVWLSSINENNLPEDIRPTHKESGVTMMHGANGFMFGSITDIDNGTSGSGSRRVGTTWYDRSRNDMLRSLGCVRGSVVHHSLKGPDIPVEILDELAAEAKVTWSEPWLSAALHGIESRTIIGIPIKEYVPDLLVKGRVAIVGDAAHAPAPITASGFNESLQDAATLGKCVAKGIRGNAAIDSLAEYESLRLNKVRRMVQSGQSMSQYFGLA